MNDLIWMSMQLSEKNVSRMMEEEVSQPDDDTSLLDILKQTYLDPIIGAKESPKGPFKRIFGDTPGSFHERKRDDW